MGSKATQSLDRVKQDINFLEYPMWAVSKGLFKKTSIPRIDSKTETYDAYIYQKDERFLIESIIGVPKLFDAVILVFLMRESQNRNYATTINDLTYYQILKSCGYGVTKTYYRKLESTLDLWSKTTFRFFNSFYTKESGHEKRNYSPIDTWGSDLIGGKKTIYVRMGTEFIEALKESRYFKYIDFDEYKKFTSPLAARLNELLIKSFLTKSEWKINIKRLAEKLTLDLKYPSLIHQKIKAAVNQVNKNSLRYSYVVSDPDRSKHVTFTRTPKEPEIIIPQEILDLIPKFKRKGCHSVCLKILKAEGEGVLFFYVKEAAKKHKKEKIDSWGAWIMAAWKRKDYENHVAAIQEKADKYKSKLSQEAKKQQARDQEQVRLKEEKEFKQREILAMSDEEHSDFVLWLESKGKRVSDTSKQMNLFFFWEETQKSYPIGNKSKEPSLFG